MHHELILGDIWLFGKCSVASQRRNRNVNVAGHTIGVDVMTGKDTCSVCVGFSVMHDRTLCCSKDFR